MTLNPLLRNQIVTVDALGSFAGQWHGSLRVDSSMISGEIELLFRRSQLAFR